MSPAGRSPGATRLAVDVETLDVRLPVARDRVADVARGVLKAEGARDAMLSVTFVDARTIARLNRKHLGHTGPTDVISFGFAPAHEGAAVVGDVYVCVDVARDNARRHGVGVREELLRLVVHGTLHVLGHDHPEDETRTGSAMWRRQETLLARALRAATAQRARAPRRGASR